MEIINFIVGLGPSVMMPIIITLIGLIMGAGFGKALRAGLTVGVGFIGLNLVIGLLGGNLGPAVQQMVTNFGLSLTVIDVGWPAAAAIAFASRVGAVIIPIALAVNVVMILTKTTQTVNIDVWNFWHYAFTGALVTFATDSFVFGVVAAIIQAVMTLVLADWTAKGVEDQLGLKGVSIPHGLSVAFVPVALVINKILDYIPGVNNIKIDADMVQKRFGLFGEPILVGTVLGAIIGFAAGYDLGPSLNLAITMGAALVLIPRMAGLLMEGLLPISDAASEFVDKRLKTNTKIYIGLDAAVGIGHPTTLAVSLILVPLSVLIAVVLPGNNFLPFADLAVLPFLFVLVVPITKGDLFRTLVVGLFIVVTGLWIASDIAPLLTAAAIDAQFTMPVGATLISSIADGASPLSWAFVKLFELRYVGIAVLGVIAAGMAYLNRVRILKGEK
jgi:galactitol PTS system EIIC component